MPGPPSPRALPPTTKLPKLPPLQTDDNNGPVYHLAVVVGCFLASLTTFSHLFMFGIWVSSYEEKYEQNRGITCAVHSLMMVCWYAVGPFAVRLAIRHGICKTYIFGSLLIATGLLLSAFAEHFVSPFGGICIAQGILVGLGGGLATVPGFLLSVQGNEPRKPSSEPRKLSSTGFLQGPDVFAPKKKRRRRSSLIGFILTRTIRGSLAPVVALGSGIGMFSYPLLVKFLLTNEGASNTLIVMACMQVVVTVIAALLMKDHLSNLVETSPPVRYQLCLLLSNWGFCTMFMASLLFASGVFQLLVHVPMYAVDMELDRYTGSYALASAGIGFVAFQGFHLFVGDCVDGDCYHLFRPVLVFQATMVSAAVIGLFWPFLRTFRQICLACFGLGFVAMSSYQLLPSMVRAFFRKPDHRAVLLHLNLAYVPAAIFPMLAGFEHDIGEKYVASQVLATSCFAVAAFVFLFVSVPQKKVSIADIKRVTNTTANQVVPKQDVVDELVAEFATAGAAVKKEPPTPTQTPQQMEQERAATRLQALERGRQLRSEFDTRFVIEIAVRTRVNARRGSRLDRLAARLKEKRAAEVLQRCFLKFLNNKIADREADEKDRAIEATMKKFGLGKDEAKAIYEAGMVTITDDYER